MNYIIIALSLFASTFISVQILKNKNNKIVSMLVALCVNTILLTLATWCYYTFDEEIKRFGFDSRNAYILVFAIPIITWLNFIALQFVNNNS